MMQIRLDMQIERQTDRWIDSDDYEDLDELADRLQGVDLDDVHQVRYVDSQTDRYRWIEIDRWVDSNVSKDPDELADRLQDLDDAQKMKNYHFHRHIWGLVLRIEQPNDLFLPDFSCKFSSLFTIGLVETE